MLGDQIPQPPEEEPRGLWLLAVLRVISRTVSGLMFLVGFVWAAPHFTGGELVLTIFLMALPMAMIWYPKQIDDFGKGGYGEGGASQVVLVVFGWLCLFIFLVVVALKAGGYW